MDNYIPSGKWPSFLALSIIFFSSSSLSMMIFLTSRFEKTQNASSRKNEDVSVCLSVCLSLSRARACVVAKKSKRRNKSHRTKKRRRRRLTAAQKKATNSLVVCREKKKKRTNANEFCLFTAQFYVQKRLNDVIFGFFLSCARVCVS